MILIEADRIWDADIISRCCLEATLQVMYIACDKNQVSWRLLEYSEKLPDIKALSNHAKAQEAISALASDAPDTVDMLSEMLLSDEEVRDIKERIPRHKMNDLKKRWGFTRMLSEVVGNYSSGREVYTGLPHSYSRSSSLVHSDFLGVVDVFDGRGFEHNQVGDVTGPDSEWLIQELAGPSCRCGQRLPRR